MGTQQGGRGWLSTVRWEAVVGVCTVLALALGVVTYLFPRPDPAPVPNPPPSQSVGPSTNSHPPVIPSPTANSSVPTSPGQVVPILFDGQVRLERETGADLEVAQKNGEIRGSYSGGIGGSTDLYVAIFNTLQVASDGLYSYPGLEKDAYTGCTEIIKSDRRPQPLVAPVSSQQFCFVTSDNRVAWTRVITSTLPFPGGGYLILRVKVWE